MSDTTDGECPKDITAKYVDMNFKVKEHERQRYKLVATLLKMSMVELLRVSFREYVEKKGILPSDPPKKKKKKKKKQKKMS